MMELEPSEPLLEAFRGEEEEDSEEEEMVGKLVVMAAGCHVTLSCRVQSSVKRRRVQRLRVWRERSMYVSMIEHDWSCDRDVVVT